MKLSPWPCLISFILFFSLMLLAPKEFAANRYPSSFSTKSCGELFHLLLRDEKEGIDLDWALKKRSFDEFEREIEKFIPEKDLDSLKEQKVVAFINKNILKGPRTLTHEEVALIKRTYSLRPVYLMSLRLHELYSKRSDFTKKMLKGLYQFLYRPVYKTLRKTFEVLVTVAKVPSSDSLSRLIGKEGQEIIDKEIDSLLLILTKDLDGVERIDLDKLKNLFRKAIFQGQKAQFTKAEKSLLSKKLIRKSFVTILIMRDLSLRSFKGARDLLKNIFVDKVPRLAYFLTPIPTPVLYMAENTLSRTFLKRPTVRWLLWKQFNNPARSLTESELRFLAKNPKLKEVYFNRKSYFQKHPYFTKLKQSYEAAKEVGYLYSSFAVINHFYHLYDGGTINSEDYLDDESNELGENEIEIITDMSPFPHTAIRMGYNVFSYSFTDLKKVNYAQYVLSNSNMAAFKRARGYEEDSSSSFSPLKVFENQPHSAQVARLKLEKKEYEKLRRFFEQESGKEYKNETGANDCTTMTARALRRFTSFSDIPSWIDASPSQLIMYFSALKSAGDSRVVKIYQLLTQDADDFDFHMGRNIFTNHLESKLFVNFFAYLRGQRVYLDATFEESELTWRDEEVEAEEIELWKKEVEEELSEDFMISMMMERVHDQEEDFGDSEKDLFLSFLDDQIKEAQELIDLPEASREEIERSQYKIVTLKKYKEDIKKRYKEGMR